MRLRFTLREPLVWRFVVITILLLAFALRLNNLSACSLRFDESIEYWVASTPPSEIHITVSNATHDPPLYSYLLHFWQRIGISEFWLRSLPVFFSVMGIAGVTKLGQSAFGREAGAIAGLLITLSAADIRYAQDTGQYSLMVCALAWNLVFLHLALSRNDWKWWGLWGGSSLVAIYSHYGSAIIVAATAFVVFGRNIVRREWTAVTRQLTVGVISIILLLPLVIIVIPPQLNRLGAATHNRLGAATRPINPLEFLQRSKDIVLFQLMGNQVGRWPWPDIPTWLVWAPIAIATIFALAKAKSVPDPPVLLIVSWVLYYLTDCLGIYFFTGTRHSLLLSPLLVVTVASGIVIIRRLNSMAGLGVLVLILAVCLLTPPQGQKDLRTTTEYWLSHRQADEVTYVYYGASSEFRYQLVLANVTTTAVPPTWYGDCNRGIPAPYCSENAIFYGRWIRHFSPDQKRESILQTIGFVPERMWIIFSHALMNEDQQILDSLEEIGYSRTLSSVGEGTSVYLLEQK